MALTPEAFVDGLLRAAPELRDLLDDHLAAYDELLLHVLMGDLLRSCVAAFHAGEPERAARVLAFLDRALRESDEAVRNAVALSFVAHAGHGPGETEAFLRTWPAGLAAERARQERWSEGGP